MKKTRIYSCIDMNKTRIYSLIDRSQVFILIVTLNLKNLENDQLLFYFKQLEFLGNLERSGKGT